MPDPGLNRASTDGDAIAEVCIRKTSGSVQHPSAISKARITSKVFPAFKRSGVMAIT